MNRHFYYTLFTHLQFLITIHPIMSVGACVELFEVLSWIPSLVEKWYCLICDRDWERFAFLFPFSCVTVHLFTDEKAGCSGHCYSSTEKDNIDSIPGCHMQRPLVQEWLHVSLWAMIRYTSLDRNPGN